MTWKVANVLVVLFRVLVRASQMRPFDLHICRGLTLVGVSEKEASTSRQDDLRMTYQLVLLNGALRSRMQALVFFVADHGGK